MGKNGSEAVVAGHICLDVIPPINARDHNPEDLFLPGQLVKTGPPLLATGGAVSNTGLALHRLGISTSLAGKVGDDLFGSAILDLLNRQDASLTDHMIVSEGESSSCSIVISPPGGDRTFFHCPGANDTFDAGDLPYESLKQAKWFHFGYPPLMKNMYARDGRALREMFSRIKKYGLTTSLDMALPDPDSEAGRVDWSVILARVLPYVDVFLPSIEEILFMLERDVYEELKRNGGHLPGRVDGELLSRLSERLLAMGAGIVVFKLGDQGLYVRSTNQEKRLLAMGKGRPVPVSNWLNRELLTPCFEVKVAGTTGAGDCTIAGFLAGVLKGLAIEETVKGAVAVGACNVEKADATSGVPDWQSVQKRLAEGWKVKKPHPGMNHGSWNPDSALWYGRHDQATGGRSGPCN